MFTVSRMHSSFSIHSTSILRHSSESIFLLKSFRIKQEATDDAVNTAMVLLLTLPLEVLMDHYWTKTYAKRIPRFTELVLEYYERWQNGELDMDKLKEDLWEYGGVKLVEGEGETA